MSRPGCQACTGARGQGKVGKLSRISIGHLAGCRLTPGEQSQDETSTEALTFNQAIPLLWNHWHKYTKIFTAAVEATEMTLKMGFKHCTPRSIHTMEFQELLARTTSQMSKWSCLSRPHTSREERAIALILKGCKRHCEMKNSAWDGVRRSRDGRAGSIRNVCEKRLGNRRGCFTSCKPFCFFPCLFLSQFEKQLL